MLEQDEFDLLELADDVESLVAAQILESGISHERFCKNVKHSQLIGSDLRLRQIMLNLFSNAIKYNKLGGRVDTYITELSCNGYTALFEFKIADTGIGMSEEFVSEHLFQAVHARAKRRTHPLPGHQLGHVHRENAHRRHGRHHQRAKHAPMSERR